MTQRRKIRFWSWYWGNYVLEGDFGFELDQDGFELYDEETHGLHNAEEYRREM